MKLLYIAYSCAPNRGSEDSIGWNLPLEAARHHEVYVITKGEYRPQIEAWCAAQPNSIHWIYVDISPAARSLLRGRAYSLRLNLWHRRALQAAAALCRREGISLIHQITPVEFRSIGDYGSIPGVTFLCGPVGGGEHIPRQLWPWMGSGMVWEGLRWSVNCLARYRLKRRGILNRCSGLLFANPETEAWLKPCLPAGVSLGICPEVGVAEDLAHRDTRPGSAGPVTFLTASRLIRRKGCRLLLDALEALPRELQWEMLIAGEGPEERFLKRKCKHPGLVGRVTFLGRVPYGQMDTLYRKADVLVLPSLRETTGSVVAEAMARGLPVILPGRFGGGAMVTGDTGWHFDSRADLSAALQEAVEHPGACVRRGANGAAAASCHSWNRKFARYERLYETLLSREG